MNTEPSNAVAPSVNAANGRVVKSRWRRMCASVVSHWVTTFVCALVLILTACRVTWWIKTCDDDILSPALRRSALVAVDAAGDVSLLGPVGNDDLVRQKVAEQASVYMVLSGPSAPVQRLECLAMSGRRHDIRIYDAVSTATTKMPLVLRPELAIAIRRLFVDEYYGADVFSAEDTAALVNTGGFWHRQIWWVGIAWTLLVLLAWHLFFVSSAHGIKRVYRGFVASRRAHRGQCLRCGYSLAGLTEGSPCPECGTSSLKMTNDRAHDALVRTVEHGS